MLQVPVIDARLKAIISVSGPDARLKAIIGTV